MVRNRLQYTFLRRKIYDQRGVKHTIAKSIIVEGVATHPKLQPYPIRTQVTITLMELSQPLIETDPNPNLISL